MLHTTDLRKHVQVLKGFQPISLDEISNHFYVNRIDTKFLFPVSRLSELLFAVTDDYRILEIDHARQCSYKTIYFDTPDHFFYHQHVNGKLNRFKVRLRTYETNGLTFLEVKHQSNKGRTSKTRIREERDDPFEYLRSQDFLQDLADAGGLALKPMIATGYTRITLLNLDAGERVTIDFSLTFNNLKGKMNYLPFVAIAEIKRDTAVGHSPFVQQLKKMGIHRTGFSKYCVGMALLDKVSKKNMIKPKLLLLNKIKDEYDRNNI